MQRVTVARFHRRSDANGYLQALQRLTPAAIHIIVFDLAAPEELTELK